MIELELDGQSPTIDEDDAASIWAESFQDDDDGDAGTEGTNGKIVR